MPGRLGAIIAAALCLAPIASGAQPAFTPGAGTEQRAWLQERPGVSAPAPRWPLSITDDVRVVARDGIVLAGRLIAPMLPAGTAPPPCILMADGYGRVSGGEAGHETPLYEFAARGYAVLNLSLRGVGRSGGTNDLYFHYGEDGYDTVEWMARQPWCDGRVGMVGDSLLGISQWLTARQLPPHLKAILPEVACGDCYGVLWYPGGMLPGPGRLARSLRWESRTEYDAAIRHREFDAFWRARSVLADDVAAIARHGIAVFIAGGLDDYITPANIRAYEQYPGPAKRLFLGPYGHGWHLEYNKEFQFQFLDHYLKGAANGADTAGKVILYIKGAGAWRAEADWPIPDARTVSLALLPARSGSIASRNDGSLAKLIPDAAAPAVLPYDPVTGPFLPALLTSGGRDAADHAPDEARVLTWTTPPLSVATEVTGTPRLVLWATSSTTDGDLVAELNDVAPDGTSRQVVQGYLNAPRARLHAPPEPLEPGRMARYELLLYPTAYVFQPGHRMRLALAGGADPRPDQADAQGPAKNPRAFTWTIAQDRDHAARLELPVIGSSWAQLEAMTGPR